MRVSQIIGKLTDKVQEILDALSNRLTATDNWGPEGIKGQILTSNGPRDTDPPPSFQDIQSIISGNPTIVQSLKGDKGDPGATGPAGVAGADGPEGPAGFMPTYIGSTETFTIPVNRQGLYALPIVNDGTLVVSGDLVMVD